MSAAPEHLAAAEEQLADAFEHLHRRPDGYAQHENSGYCRHCASREKT